MGAKSGGRMWEDKVATSHILALMGPTVPRRSIAPLGAETSGRAILPAGMKPPWARMVEPNPPTPRVCLALPHSLPPGQSNQLCPCQCGCYGARSACKPDRSAVRSRMADNATERGPRLRISDFSFVALLRNQQTSGVRSAIFSCISPVSVRCPSLDPERQRFFWPSCARTDQQPTGGTRSHSLAAHLTSLRLRAFGRLGRRYGRHSSVAFQARQIRLRAFVRQCFCETLG